MSRFIFLVFFIGFAPGLKAEYLYVPCENISIHSHESFGLSELEKRLVCGDPNSESYQNIPIYQAQFLLKSFFESRGYLNPRFENSGEIYLGARSRLKSFEFLRSISDEDDEVLRNYIENTFLDKVLNPDLVDAMEVDLRSWFRRRGYPCVEISSSVDVVSSGVNLSFGGITQNTFGNIILESIEGIDSESLTRFYPFESDELFNEDKLVLTEKRFLRSGVVQGTYFLEQCSDDYRLRLSQNFLIGPPRVLRFGLGVSTELGPMVRVRWNHNHYGNRASTLGARLQASLKQQSLILDANSFLWGLSPRRSLLTELLLSHENVDAYAEIRSRLRSHIQRTYDSYGHKWSFSLGPTWNVEHFKKDEDRAFASQHSISLESRTEFMSHDYEIYDMHPESGRLAHFSIDHRNPFLGFPFSIIKIDASYREIKNLGFCGAGLCIGGLRFLPSLTLLDKKHDFALLAPSLKNYAGGIDDMRGFAPSSLPGKDSDAYSKYVMGLELRKTRFVLDSIEGLLFWDNAYLELDSTEDKFSYWTSTGLGVRWLSPIGLVQTYLAKSYRITPFEDKGFYFYLGLGGEF